VTDKKEKVSKDIAYNKKRKPLFRVEVSTADTAEDIAKMEQMKADLIAKSKTAKKGVIDMYEFAKEKGYFEKLKFDTGVHKKNKRI
jgi:protein subunit release factor A